jgi:hypothetical protein
MKLTFELLEISPYRSFLSCLHSRDKSLVEEYKRVQESHTPKGYESSSQFKRFKTSRLTYFKLVPEDLVHELVFTRRSQDKGFV